MKIPERILLAHGAGGRLSHELIEGVFLPAFSNPELESLDDAAILPELPPGRLAMTTDGHVVDPPTYPGGDLGSLSVNGTVNDLVMVGADPLYLSWALILEEGLEGEKLRQHVESARRAAEEAGVTIVAGDTKTVPRGRGDGIYAVSAGIGVVPEGRRVSDRRIEAGDAILLTGTAADHGATIMALRHGLEGPGLHSDCAPLNHLIGELWKGGIDIHAMHDPTRGGIATTCNEAASRSSLRFLLSAQAIPIAPGVYAVCEILGLDELYLASEGRALIFLPGNQSEAALEILHAHPQGRDAASIGVVLPAEAGHAPVELETLSGSLRPLDMLSGMDLPRIC